MPNGCPASPSTFVDPGVSHMFLMPTMQPSCFGSLLLLPPAFHEFAFVGSFRYTHRHVSRRICGHSPQVALCLRGCSQACRLWSDNGALPTPLACRDSVSEQPSMLEFIEVGCCHRASCRY